MPGRLVYEPLSMINHAFILFSNIINSYAIPQTSTGISYISTSNILNSIPALLILCSLLVFIVVIKFSKSIQRRFIDNENVKNVISVLLLIGCMVVLSVGPLTPNILVHLWHYFLPSIFILLFLCLVIFTLLKPKMFYAITSFIIIISIINIAQQIKLHKTASMEQEHLLEFIKTESNKWKDDCQVIIITDKIPYMSGFGGVRGLRDLGYLKFQAGRPDIKFASIATEKVLNRNIVHSRLDNNKPTYLYRFSYSTNRSDQLHHLLIARDGFANLYAASDTGITIIEKQPIESISHIHKEYNISPQNYIFLKVAENIGVMKYDGNYLSFHGDGFLQETVNIDNTPSVLTFEIMLFSTDNVCKNISKFSESCPPMPIVAYPLAIYQADNNIYTFQIKHKNGDKYIKYNFDSEQWQKFVLSFDLENNIFYFFVNDTVYDIVKGIDIDVANITSVTLGKGYRQRFWKGDVAYFKIYESTGSIKNYYLDIPQ